MLDGQAATRYEVVQVPFHDDVLEACRGPDGKVMIPIKRPCEALGLAYSSQLKKLREKTWARVAIIAIQDSAGRQQEMACIPLDRLAMWLANIDAGRIDQGLCEKLELYQEEAADAPHENFFGKVEPSTPPDLALLRGMVYAIDTNRRLAEESKQISLASAQKSAVTDAKVEAVAAKADKAQATASAALAVHSCNQGYFSVLAYWKLRGLGDVTLGRGAQREPAGPAAWAQGLAQRPSPRASSPSRAGCLSGRGPAGAWSPNGSAGGPPARRRPRLGPLPTTTLGPDCR
jgi:hypothetical protein